MRVAHRLPGSARCMLLTTLRLRGSHHAAFADFRLRVRAAPSRSRSRRPGGPAGLRGRPDRRPLTPGPPASLRLSRRHGLGAETGDFFAAGFGAILGYLILGLRPGQTPAVWTTVLGSIVVLALFVPALLVGRRHSGWSPGAVGNGP